MIAFYKGKSLLSRGIQLRTWSEYSHAAWLFGDESVIEAWTNGVRHVSSLSRAHTPGTVVDVFRVPEIDDATIEASNRRQVASAFLLEQLGKPYDFQGIFGFLLRKEEQSPEKWFCSELCFAACKQAGVELLSRVPAWKVDPGLLSLSPRLVFSHSVVTV